MGRVAQAFDLPASTRTGGASGRQQNTRETLSNCRLFPVRCSTPHRSRPLLRKERGTRAVLLGEGRSEPEVEGPATRPTLPINWISISPPRFHFWNESQNHWKGRPPALSRSFLSRTRHTSIRHTSILCQPLTYNKLLKSWAFAFTPFCNPEWDNEIRRTLDYGKASSLQGLYHRGPSLQAAGHTWLDYGLQY